MILTFLEICFNVLDNIVKKACDNVGTSLDLVQIRTCIKYFQLKTSTKWKYDSFNYVSNFSKFPYEHWKLATLLTFPLKKLTSPSNFLICSNIIFICLNSIFTDLWPLNNKNQGTSLQLLYRRIVLYLIYDCYLIFFICTYMHHSLPLTLIAKSEEHLKRHYCEL